MAHEDDLKLGCLLVADELASPLPLTLTTVTGHIAGAVASVVVTQHFHNPLRTPIELSYLFPLPHRAAIVDYQITIGERVIKADIKEAETAERAYREAVEQGRRASLLEQQRPNLFSIQIGNVQPGETIITQVHYDERLNHRDGIYEFVFPMGITPRYHTPTLPLDGARRVDAPVTLDDAQVAPVEISLDLRPGLAVDPPTSGTHLIQVTSNQGDEYRIALAQRTIPSKDFVLRYQASTDAVRSACWSSREGDIETALITLLPPRFEPSATAPAREFIFVIDRSGSMSGKPIEQAKNALRACIRALRETDTFTIQAFDNQISWFSTRTMPVTQANVQAADQWLDQIDGRGGTEILPALQSALALPADAERQRYIVFLTDGAVSAEREVLRRIAEQRGKARIFSFGIGPSVNRYLLSKLAQMGRGVAEFLRVDEDIEAAITRFHDRVSYPILQDITLEWQGAEAWDTYPEVLPDLYIGQPLEVVTRLKHAAPATLKVSGTLRGQKQEMPIDLPPATEANPALQRLWARARIESLLDREPSMSESVRAQIISLGLDHRIVTPFTSFVAIDSEVAPHADRRHVTVAVPLPEGLDFEGFFGHREAGPQFLAMRTSHLASSFTNRVYDTDSIDIPAFLRRSSSPADRSAPAQAEPQPRTVDDRLKWLARTQNVDGSWEGVEMTAVALLAFVRAGHTTREGSYRRQVDKVARWLRDRLTELSGFDLLIAVRALATLTIASGDHPVPDSIRLSLPEPQSDVERAARGLAPRALPSRIRSLDDLRIAALVQGDVDAPDLRVDSARRSLVEAWLAVGKPLL